MLNRLIVVPLVLAALASCKSRPHDQEPAPSAKTSESAGDIADARDRVVRESQAKLDELDVKLANLKRDAQARSATVTAESKAELDDAIAKLEQQRASAQRVLDDAKNSTAEQWQQVKRRADEALKKVDDAYQAAAEKLRG